ncbi:retropepsin-like domain-containing protein [Candidatus Nomurabacteria bacterium]|nr:retropepsin-like domain-containing protein [Candidatus Nomurabacteria bacterium]
MKFHYQKYGLALRPVIGVNLKLNSKAINYEVLVDSGADICIFHSEVGEALGLDISKGKPREVFGVGGKASLYYLHDVEIEVGGWTYKIEAGFMPDISGKTMLYGVVGQKGFFENFVIKFDYKKQELELKPRE